MNRLPRSLVVLSLGIVACGHSHDDDTTQVSGAVTVPPAIQFSVSLTTPKNVSARSVLFGATGSVMVGAGTTLAGAGSTLSTITNMGSGGIDAEPDAVLGNVWSTSTVALKDRVHVKGVVHAPSVTVGNSVLIDGGKDSTTPQTPATVTSWTVNYPAVPSPNVTVNGGQTGSQVPGRYAAVTVFSGGKLTLQTGTYYLDSFDLEPGAQLVLNQTAGPIFVYVRTSLIWRGTFATSANAPADFLLGYLGSAATFIEAPFSGTFVSTSAPVTLRSVTAGHSGQFFGPSVSVDPHVTVTFRVGSVLPVLAPIADCIINRTGGGFTGIFGYSNPSAQVIHIPAGQPQNTVSTSPSAGQPSWFQPGTHHAAFSLVSTTGSSVSWTLGTGTATLSGSTAQCTIVNTPSGPQLQFSDGSNAPLPLDPTAVLAASVVATDATGGVTVGPKTGSFHVTQTGSAAYQIPLWVSPAGPGATPDLSLQYSSSGADGPIGIGWSLSGLSRILRCSQTLAQDNALVPVTYGAQGTANANTFCLDGQRLVPVRSVNNIPVEFRTEQDGFSRITILASGTNGPTGWEVRSKDGQILQYGVTTDSQMTVLRHVYAGDPTTTNPPTFTNESVTYGWLLSSAKDRFGNTMSLTYSNHAIGSGTTSLEVLLDKIDYGTSLAPNSRTISFLWDFFRNDFSFGHYVSGVELDTGHLLHRITMSGPAPTAKGTLRTYTMAYDSPTVSKRTLLTSVTECDGAAVCKAPIKLSYEAGSLDYHEFDPALVNPQTGLPSGNIFPASGADLYAELEAADFNGDGWDDVLYRTQPTGQNRATWFIRYGDGESIGPAVAVPELPTGVEDDAGTGYAESHAIDFDADGRTDMIVWRPLFLSDPATPGTILPDVGWLAFRSTPSGFQQMDPPGPTTPPNKLRTRQFGPYYGDLNGDGLPDVVPPSHDGITGTSLWHYLLATPSGLAGNPVSHLFDPFAVEKSSNYAINLEGTAKVSFLVRDATTASGNLAATGTRFVALSLGSDALLHTSTPTSLLAPDPSGEKPCTAADPSCQGVQANMASSFTYRFLDVTGDGLADAVRINNTGGQIQAVWNTGITGFAAPGNPPSTTPDRGAPDSVVGKNFIDAGIRAFDFDEDGLQDLYYGGNSGAASARTSGMAVTHVGVIPSFINVAAGPAPVPIGDNYDQRGWRTTAIMDVNGDGLDDIVTTVKGALRIYRRSGKKADMLTKVTDASGATLEINYQPISQMAPQGGTRFYTPATDCSFPIQCVKRGLWVVSFYRFDNGLFAADSGVGGSTTTITYQYAGGRADIQGRGFLGFDTVTEINQLSTQKRTRHFTNATSIATATGRAYPFAGVVDKETVESQEDPFGAGPNGPVNRRTTTSHYEVVATNGSSTAPGTFVTRLHDSDYQETEQDTPAVPEAVIRHFTTVDSYDTFNNLKESLVTASDGSTVDTFDDYTADTTSWLLAKQTRHEVINTVTGPNAETVSRKTTYVPDATTGLASQKTAFGDDADTTMVTGFVRNAIGLPCFIMTVPSSQALPALACSNVPQAGSTSPTQRTIQIIYDAEGLHPSQVVDSLGHITDYVYHPGIGQVVATQDDNGVSEIRQFDGFVRTKSITATGVPTVSFTYALATDMIPGNSDTKRIAYKVTTSRSGLGDLTEYFDRLQRPLLVKAQTAAGAILVGGTRYDSLGFVELVADPQTDNPLGGQYKTQLGHDPFGRLISESSPKHSTFFKYGHLTTTATDGNGNQTVYVDDELGRLSSSTSTGPNGPITTTYDYGAFNTTRHVRNQSAPDGMAITYDRRGFRKTLSDPATGAITYHYDGFGNLAEQIDARQVDSVYTTDPLGRPLTETVGSIVRSFTWDTAANGVGKLASITATGTDNVSVGFAYDALSRSTDMTWTIDGQPYTLTQEYDSLGRVGQIDYPAFSDRRLSAVMHYSPTGELSFVSDVPGTTEFWRARQIDPFGRVTEEALGGKVVVNRDYDPIDALLTELRATSIDGATKLRDVKVGFDGAGNLKTRQDVLSGVQESFDYDGLNRLKVWHASTKPDVVYDYDDFGNMITRTVVGQALESFSYGERGFPFTDMTTGPLGQYKYDPIGNTNSAPDNSFSFDDTGTLTGITPTAGSNVNLRFDGTGTRRVKKTATGTTTYVGGLYEKRVESGATTHVLYIPAGNRIIGQLVWSDDGKTSTQVEADYFQTDQVDTIELVTGADGTPKLSQRRDPFGRAINPTTLAEVAPTQGSVRLGFGSHEEDRETGLVNMNARLYDPKLGRFTSPNPRIQIPTFGQSLNRFAFGLNNPMTYSDPTGLDIIIENCGITVACTPANAPDDPDLWGGGGESITVIGSRSQSTPLQGDPALLDMVQGGNSDFVPLSGKSSDTGDSPGTMGGENNGQRGGFNPIALTAGPPAGEVFEREMARQLSELPDKYVKTAVAVYAPWRIVAVLIAAGFIDESTANAPRNEEEARTATPNRSALGEAALITAVIVPGIAAERGAALPGLSSAKGEGFGSRINTGQGQIAKENCAFCTAGGSSAVKVTSSDAAAVAGMQEGAISLSDVGQLFSKMGLGNGTHQTFSTFKDAAAFMKAAPTGSKFGVAYLNPGAGMGHVVAGQNTTFGLLFRDFQASGFPWIRPQGMESGAQFYVFPF